MSSVLEAAVRRIESARGLGRKPTKARDEGRGEKAATESQAAATELEQLLGSPAVASVLAAEQREQFRLSGARIKQAARDTADIVRERDDLLRELNLLRILASMGLTIAEFTHDFSALAETMELSVQAIKRDAAISPEALDATLAQFEEQFRRVRSYTAHFGNMTGALFCIRVRPVVIDRQRLAHQPHQCDEEHHIACKPVGVVPHWRSSIRSSARWSASDFDPFMSPPAVPVSARADASPRKVHAGYCE